MHIQQIEIVDFTCHLFLPKHYHESDRNYPVIYVNGEIPVTEIVSELYKKGQQADFILLSIKPNSWNDDFTPWTAPAFRRGEEAPQGRADIYIARLAEEIKPYMDTNYRTRPEPEYTALIGYSLGGLVALYAVYRTDRFGMIGSLSGSLWYDDFCEFMERAKPLRTDIYMYLSLGIKEKQSRNPRMSRVADCTIRARVILTDQLIANKRDESMADSQGNEKSKQINIPNSQGNEKSIQINNPNSEGNEKNRHINMPNVQRNEEKKPHDQMNISGIHNGSEKIYFEWNEGGHFHDITGRFVKAITWWMQNLN